MSELVDVARLAGWLASVGLATGTDLTVEPLAGGASNAMFVVRAEGQEWVLRRPTRVSHERANEGMRREFMILRALAGSDVPHPEAVALCDDPGVLDCTFYLMGRVDGIPPLPESLPPEFTAHRRDIAFALVDALVAIHRVDWRAAGLAGLDRSAGFHDRQVARWTSQLASYGGRELPGIDRVASWLDAHRPGDFRPTIMHGDYHMLNVLIGREPPVRVTAVLDWETATIADPLLDLAGFCEVWCSVARAGWPTRSELIERYAAGRGLPGVGALTYYEALYNFRLAVLLEGAYERSTADGSAGMTAMGDRVLFCVERALAIIDDAS
jgi:aminoglycoside phosphotransferase (APT) family kinase protein